MAFNTEGSGMYMPVAPAYGGGGFMNGFDSDIWLILIIMFALFGNGFGGWGGMGIGGGYGSMGMIGGAMYPWMNQMEYTQAGFNQAAVSGQITGLQSAVTSGFGDVQLGIAGVNQNICQTGNGIVQAVSNGFANAESSANARQMANMQTAFAAQTAQAQGFNGVQSQLASNSADNRLGIADLKYTVATENCADRTAAAQNTRDIMENCNRNNQAILDKLCQLELDGVKAQVEAKNDRIAELQTQLNMANLAASQVEQTSALRANQATVANQLVSELRSCPIPSQPVYGNQPIFTCSGPVWNNNGCGCGNGFYN